MWPSSLGLEIRLRCEPEGGDAKGDERFRIQHVGQRRSLGDVGSVYLKVLHVGAGLEKMCVFDCAHSSLSRSIPIRSH